MDDEDFGSDRDPLLVRPFLVQDDAPGEHTVSEATWPAGSASDSATQVLPVFSGSTGTTPEPRRSKRRTLLVAGGGAGVVAVLAVAGYTALGPGRDASFSDGLPGPSFPVVTGPPTASASAGAAVTDETVGGGGNTDAGGGSTPGRTGATTTPTTTTATTTPSSGATSGTPSTATTGSVAPTGTAQPNAPALAPSPPKAGTGTLVSGNGLCLDLANAIPADDNVIQVFDCNRTVAQVWTLAGDGTLRVMGKCAMLVGDDTVHLTGCDGRTTAQWRVGDGRELVNAASNRCLTDPSDGARPGTRVVVVRCTGRSNQAWSLR
ncbi:hypothetical protein Acy02nite_28300 [Actinoplanes cyaneus]|uniref:Ricin B lectin domain-containing protein n=1 Tax=Actinoplanes cyaneus TaxID=52696 RepID=A0A919IFX4_9ACTN|nr:RICIN domain-containing protein [Actinoplanes cyaneus]GID64949.1 hypothetical protein Acy02nite_28300 [Actinoplanes cyaneus]